MVVPAHENLKSGLGIYNLKDGRGVHNTHIAPGLSDGKADYETFRPLMALHES